jgi:zinc D-Ala-D-Ala carboxypeptidase
MQRSLARRALSGLVVLVFGVLLAGAPSRAVQARSWASVDVGDSGANVFAVQGNLLVRGYSLTYDGMFGSGTESVVRSFQVNNGLASTGVVDQLTWEKLVVTVQRGTTSKVVDALQRELNKHGSSLTVDGVFGSGTETAVSNFQKSKGLTADGIVGLNTWAALTLSPGASTTRAQLATQIRDHARITLLTYHVSGISDSASTARQNIVDTANGGQARTSAYSDVGVTAVNLSVPMLDGMLKLATTYGYSYRVTEIAGGDHSSTSRHYVGVAFDVDLINGVQVNSSNPYQSAFRSRCAALGATEVLGPGDPDHSTHIHCGWPRP